MLDHLADNPSADAAAASHDAAALVAARGFYRNGMVAGLNGKTGPFPMMAAADLFFYRGWRCARGREAKVKGEQDMRQQLRMMRRVKNELRSSGRVPQATATPPSAAWLIGEGSP